MRYYIDEVLRIKATKELLDRGFILDTEDRLVEWNPPYNGPVLFLHLDEVEYEDRFTIEGERAGVSIEDGELIGIPEEEYFSSFRK